MPTTSYTSNHPDNPSVGIGGWKWEAMPNGNDGTPLLIDRRTDRSVQVSGTFGAGGTVVIEGSNDGTNYYTLNDLQGTALSFTSARLEGISEVPLYVRPRVTAGDGTTSINVYLVAVGRGA